MKIVVDTPEDFKAWLSEKPTLSSQWAEANAPVPAPTPELEVTEPMEVVIDTTKVVAQIIK